MRLYQWLLDKAFDLIAWCIERKRPVQRSR